MDGRVWDGTAFRLAAMAPTARVGRSQKCSEPAADAGGEGGSVEGARRRPRVRAHARARAPSSLRDRAGSRADRSKASRANERGVRRPLARDGVVARGAAEARRLRGADGGATEGESVASVRHPRGRGHRPRDDIRRRAPGCVSRASRESRRCGGVGVHHAAAAAASSTNPSLASRRRVRSIRSLTPRRRRRRVAPRSPRRPPPLSPLRRVVPNLLRVRGALSTRRSVRGRGQEPVQQASVRDEPRASGPRREREDRRRDRGLPPAPDRVLPGRERDQVLGVPRAQVQGARPERRRAHRVRAAVSLHPRVREAGTAVRARRDVVLLSREGQGARRRAAAVAARAAVHARRRVSVVHMRRRGDDRVEQGARCISFVTPPVNRGVFFFSLRSAPTRVRSGVVASSSRARAALHRYFFRRARQPLVALKHHAAQRLATRWYMTTHVDVSACRRAVSPARNVLREQPWTVAPGERSLIHSVRFGRSVAAHRPLGAHLSLDQTITQTQTLTLNPIPYRASPARLPRSTR